jgi:hypothetical protein
MSTLMTKMTRRCARMRTTQIKAMLTDEQKPKFDAYLAAQPQPTALAATAAVQHLLAVPHLQVAHHDPHNN